MFTPERTELQQRSSPYQFRPASYQTGALTTNGATFFLFFSFLFFFIFYFLLLLKKFSKKKKKEWNNISKKGKRTEGIHFIDLFSLKMRVQVKRSRHPRWRRSKRNLLMNKAARRCSESRTRVSYTEVSQQLSLSVKQLCFNRHGSIIFPFLFFFFFFYFFCRERNLIYFLCIQARTHQPELCQQEEPWRVWQKVREVIDR